MGQLLNGPEKEWDLPKDLNLPKILPTLDLTIDTGSLERVTALLKQNDVNFSVLKPTIEDRKGFTLISIPKQELNLEIFNNIKSNLKISHFLNESGTTNSKLVNLKYHKLLQNRYSNRNKSKSRITAKPSLASINSRLKTPEYPSNELLTAIKNISILSPQQQQKIESKLSVFDRMYLEANAQMKDGLYDLSSLQEKFLDILTPEEAIVLRHVEGETLVEFENQMTKTIGKKELGVAVANVNRLKDKNLEPRIISQSVPVPLKARKEPTTELIPPPSIIKRGVKPSINLGSPDSALGVALAPPDDYFKTDLTYPIEYKGEKYLSVQDAHKTLSENMSGKEKYALSLDLMTVKFAQNPSLVKEVKYQGGNKWLDICRCTGSSSRDFWKGRGRNSPLVRLLQKAYNLSQKENSSVYVSKIAGLTQEQKQEAAKIAFEKFPVSKAPASLKFFSNDPLAASLSLSTNMAHGFSKKIDQKYPIDFRNNPYRAANKGLPGEKYYYYKQMESHLPLLMMPFSILLRD